MIRRISANNDYRDIVRSCPSGVINDIYAIEYYVKGYDGVYSAAFSKTGSLLEVIIPSSALKTLHSGVLMRRAKYRNEDPAFPDGNYDLEFVEDMNVWLENGSEPGPGPVPGEYLTADDLKTINNESLVGEGNIQIDPGVPAQTFADHVIGNIQAFSALDNRVTALEQGGGGGGVSQEQFDAHKAENAAQFSGIDQSLGNLNQLVQKAQGDAGDAIQKNADQDARMDAIEMKNDAKNAQQDARMDNAEAHFKAVEDITDTLSDAVNGLDQRVTDLEKAGFATSQDLEVVDAMVRDVRDSVDGIDQRVTTLEQGGGGGTWGSITGDIADQQDLIAEFNKDRGRLDDLENGTLVPTGTATESWVQGQGYASDTDLDSLESRVSVLEHGGSPVSLVWGGISGTITDQTDLVSYIGNQGFLTSSDLSGYATEQWVDNKLMTDGYLTEYMADQRYPTFNWIESVGYASESWVSEQGYAVNDPNDPFITESVLTDVLAGDDNRVLREDDLGSYAQMSWVQGQGYLTSSSTLPASQITCNISGDVFDFENVDAGLTALVSRVEDQMDNITSLDNRVTEIENGGYATQTWVGQQGYITSSALSGYATRTWVQGQGYATQKWATNQFLEESKVWSGTETQWNQLTAEEKASYTIALITQ